VHFYLTSKWRPWGKLFFCSLYDDTKTGQVRIHGTVSYSLVWLLFIEPWTYLLIYLIIFHQNPLEVLL